MHAHDFGFSSGQLWRVGFYSQNRSKYAVVRLGTTLERTRFCSYCVGLFIYCQQSVAAEGSACPRVNLATRVRFLGPLHFSSFLSFFLRGHVTSARLRTPLTNVLSVAEWLALLRCQWWLGFAVQILSAIKCHGQPHKTREGSLESGRMSITPRQPRSHWEDQPSLTLTNYASGGSAWIHPILSDLGS